MLRPVPEVGVGRSPRAVRIRATLALTAAAVAVSWPFWAFVPAVVPAAAAVAWWMWRDVPPSRAHGALRGVAVVVVGAALGPTPLVAWELARPGGRPWEALGAAGMFSLVALLMGGVVAAPIAAAIGAWCADRGAGAAGG